MSAPASATAAPARNAACIPAANAEWLTWVMAADLHSRGLQALQGRSIEAERATG
jgi:hypothetical protein